MSSTSYLLLPPGYPSARQSTPNSFSTAHEWVCVREKERERNESPADPCQHFVDNKHWNIPAEYTWFLLSPRSYLNHFQWTEREWMGWRPGYYSSLPLTVCIHREKEKTFSRCTVSTWVSRMTPAAADGCGWNAPSWAERARSLMNDDRLSAQGLGESRRKLWRADHPSPQWSFQRVTAYKGISEHCVHKVSRRWATWRVLIPNSFPTLTLSMRLNGLMFLTLCFQVQTLSSG